MKKNLLIVAGVMLGGGLSWGLGADSLIQVQNSFRFQWNDNYYQASTNKTSTGVITEAPEVMANFNRETTFIGLHYRPSFMWFTDPSIDRRQTVQHELDVNWNQTVSSRIQFSINEALRRGVQPEMLDRNNALVFPDQSYFENTLNGTLGIQLRESTRLDGSARYYVMRYDSEAVATNANYTLESGGLALRQELSKATTVSGSFNYDRAEYSQIMARSASTMSLGGSVDHTFGPRLLGSVSAGYQLKSFDLTSISGQNSPYGSFSVTYLFDPRLRMTAGASYSLWEADITNYASQERLSSFASLGYDASARVSFFLSGGITRGKYRADQSVIPGDVSLQGADQTTLTKTQVVDGLDTVYQLSARVSYQLNRHNWLDVGYAYTTVSSDLRPTFAQNTYDIGWRITF